MNRNAFQNMLIVGVEDGSFQKGLTQKAILVAVLFRGVAIEDIKIVKITVDGLDATKKLIETLDGWKFETLLLAGVSFAGFNLIDPTVINETFGKPVIIVSRKKPNNEAVKYALQKHFDDWRIRWKVFEQLGPVYKVEALRGETPIYIEPVGMSVQKACKILQILSIRSKIPEPLRVARLIAHGLSQLKGTILTSNV